MTGRMQREVLLSPGKVLGPKWCGTATFQHLYYAGFSGSVWLEFRKRRRNRKTPNTGSRPLIPRKLGRRWSYPTKWGQDLRWVNLILGPCARWKDRKKCIARAKGSFMKILRERYPREPWDCLWSQQWGKWSPEGHTHPKAGLEGGSLGCFTRFVQLMRDSISHFYFLLTFGPLYVWPANKRLHLVGEEKLRGTGQRETLVKLGTICWPLLT